MSFIKKLFTRSKKNNIRNYENQTTEFSTLNNNTNNEYIGDLNVQEFIDDYLTNHSIVPSNNTFTNNQTHNSTNHSYTEKKNKSNNNQNKKKNNVNQKKLQEYNDYDNWCNQHIIESTKGFGAINYVFYSTENTSYTWLEDLFGISGIVNQTGYFIHNISIYSSLYSAGINDRDTIISINGKDIIKFARTEKGKIKENDLLTVEVQRYEKILKFYVHYVPIEKFEKESRLDKDKAHINDPFPFSAYRIVDNLTFRDTDHRKNEILLGANFVTDKNGLKIYRLGKYGTLHMLNALCGDMITKINNKKIRRLKDLYTLNLNEGEEVRVIIQRNNKTLELKGRIELINKNKVLFASTGPKSYENIIKYKEQGYAFGFDTNILMDINIYEFNILKDASKFISKKTFDELDKLKSKDGNKGYKARRAFDQLEEAQVNGEDISIIPFDIQYTRQLGLNPSLPDDVIIASFLKYQEQTGQKVAYISNDRGSRITARNAGLTVI